MRDKNDAYEDIYSGRELDDAVREYEDVYSGRDMQEAFPNETGSSVYTREAYHPRGVKHEGFSDVYSSKKEPPQKRPPRKKRSRGKRVLALLLVLVLLVAGVGGYFGYSLLDKINYVPSEHSNLYLDSAKLMHSRRVKNILFIGCDADEGGSQRSDSIMLVSIDRKHHSFKLTSFMRDTWVYIPDHDYAKLNAAFAYGGAGLLIDTLEYNFGVKIDNYAMVDFEIFSSIIDELGGVEVEVTEKEAAFINATTRQTVESGLTTLNGEEALVYCRIRKLDSDFFRTQRQRKVMTAIVDKVKHANVFTFYKVAEVILPQVKTDITKGEMIGIGMGVFGYLTYEVEQLRIPVDGSYTDQYFGAQQALSIDFDTNKRELIHFIYEEDNH